MPAVMPAMMSLCHVMFPLSMGSMARISHDRQSACVWVYKSFGPPSFMPRGMMMPAVMPARIQSGACFPKVPHGGPAHGRRKASLVPFATRSGPVRRIDDGDAGHITPSSNQ
jgi:hypothetical protein